MRTGPGNQDKIPKKSGEIPVLPRPKKFIVFTVNAGDRKSLVNRTII